MFYIILLCCAILSKFIQCLTDYELRGIKVNFMRHLALLRVVSRFPPMRSGATLSILAMSVSPHEFMVSRCQVSRFQSPQWHASRIHGGDYEIYLLVTAQPWFTQSLLL